MELLLQVYNSDDDADIAKGAVEGSETSKDIQGPAAKPEKDGLSAAEPGSLQKSKYGARSRLPGADALLAGFKGSGVDLGSPEACIPGHDWHQGRVRTFPHVEGHYPTHVYITVAPPQHVKQQQEAVLQSFTGQIPELQPVRDSAALPAKDASLLQPHYHLSLSRTVPVRYHQIQPLVAELRACLSKTASFPISLNGLEVFDNEDQTRTFLALGVAAGCEQVCRAIRRVDTAFTAHGLQQFHREPRPHVSLLWALGSQSGQLRAAAAELACTTPAWEITVRRLECRIGERVHAVWEE